MKTIYIFVIILIGLLFISCGYVQDTKMYFNDISPTSFNNDGDYLIKRHIFLHDILKEENVIASYDFNKGKVIYNGKIYFVLAPRYLPQRIRQKYRNLTDDFYKLVLNDRKYISFMKNISFYALEVEDEFILKINKMAQGDILFTSLNDGYAVFLFEGIKFSDSSNDRKNLDFLRLDYKEKNYMNTLYYSKDVIRNYSFLFDITNRNQDKVIASYKNHNIYIKDLHNEYLDSKLKNRILNETNEITRITIFEENVFRPLIEKIHFSSMDMRMHPMYNIYKYKK